MHILYVTFEPDELTAIKEVMKDKGITQTKISEHLDLSQGEISRILSLRRKEKDKRPISGEKAGKLYGMLGCDPRIDFLRAFYSPDTISLVGRDEMRERLVNAIDPLLDVVRRNYRLYCTSGQYSKAGELISELEEMLERNRTIFRVY